jgi:hypothetical protein
MTGSYTLCFMVNEFSAGGRQSPRRLFVFSLAIAYFATATLDTFLSLLLVDIASNSKLLWAPRAKSEHSRVLPPSLLLYQWAF